MLSVLPKPDELHDGADSGSGAGDGAGAGAGFRAGALRLGAALLAVFFFGAAFLAVFTVLFFLRAGAAFFLADFLAFDLFAMIVLPILARK